MMNKNDLLEKFYSKRRSLILRSLISIVGFFLILFCLLKIQNDEEYIAKINIQGIIQDRTDIIDEIDNLINDNNVKGLLAVINSPGGTYVGSKELFDSIKLLSKKIPTVVYMREMATSGGYLVSLSADKIYGNSGTITGSIGVILQTADISELLNQIGITPVIIKSGKLKAVPNPAEKIDEEKIIYLQEVIEKMQREFMELVKSNREISNSTSQLIRDGRIFTGKQAKELNLIDDLGNEKDALNWLKEKGELDETIKIKELLGKNDLKSILDFKFLKKKFKYLNQNFYNGFFAIWMPGI